MEIKKFFYINPHLKKLFTNGIYSLLKRADPQRALTSFTLSLYVTHIVSFRVMHSY